jgi:hypothetical protein
LIENARHEDHADLYEAIAAIAPGKSTGEINATRLGRWIGQFAKRIQNNLRLEFMGERQHRNLFRVVFLKKGHTLDNLTAKGKEQGVREGRGGRGVFSVTPCEVSEFSNMTLQEEALEIPHDPHDPHTGIPQISSTSAEAPCGISGVDSEKDDLHQKNVQADDESSEM